MEGFSTAMALVDYIPVLLFGGSALLLYGRFGSVLFLIGALCSFVAGLLKATWKLGMGAAQKDRAWMNRCFLPLQIGGFALMLASLILDWRRIDLAAVGAAVTSLPSAVFFALWVAGLAGMIVRAKRFDNSAKANWGAEALNTGMQAALFLGLLLL